MATTFTTIIANARVHLNETSSVFWTDAELTEHAIAGAKDLWRRIVDLYEDYFITVDETNVTLSANTSTLSGVPNDCYRVVAIEPRVVGEQSSNRGVIFVPRKWNHPEFVQARALSAQPAQNVLIMYTLMNAGAPVGAPSIYVGPQISTAMNLRLVYNQTLPSSLAIGSNNPIPGESDNAIKSWIVAYARAKERDDSAPDPEWMAIYGTEKVNLMQQLVPRQTQEIPVAEAFFEDLWPDWS